MDRIAANFVKIAEAGGLASAARKLGVSPSTVTTQIQDLEDRLGVRLLNRSTRKVSLTEIGKGYYERCMHILAHMDAADSAVEAMHAKLSGTLHLNVSVAIPLFVACYRRVHVALPRREGEHDDKRSHGRPGRGGNRSCDHNAARTELKSDHARRRFRAARGLRQPRLFRASRRTARAERSRESQLHEIYVLILGQQVAF